MSRHIGGILSDHEINILREALVHYEQTFKMWLTMKMATEAEKQLAQMRVNVVKDIREKLDLSIHGADPYTPHASGEDPSIK